MKRTRQRDPLAPIDLTVGLLLWLIVGLWLVFAALALYGLVTTGSTQVTWGAINDEEVCLEDVTAVPVEGNGRRTGGIGGLDVDLARGTATSWRVCLADASAGQRWSVVASQLLTLVGVVGSLALLSWTLRGARRAGLFTTLAARRTRVLGWFMLLVGLAAPVVRALVEGHVLSAVVRGYSWSDPLWEVTFNPAFSLLTIVVAIGIITFARVLERAVPLQEEVDATV